MLLVMALLAVQAQGATGKATALKPISPPGSWITDDDYPAAAMRAGHQGTVSFEMQIDSSGLPSGCSVTASSGFDDLDHQACALLLQRARFSPARDASGKAIAAKYLGRFTWRVSTSADTPLTDSYSRLEVEFSATGDVVRCNLHDTRMPRDLTSCSAFQGGVPEEFRRFAGADGKRRLVVLENATAVSRSLPPLESAKPGHVQLHYYRRRMTFDASGATTGCTAEAQVGGSNAPFNPQPCDGGSVQAPVAADGKPRAGTVTLISVASRVDL